MVVGLVRLARPDVRATAAGGRALQRPHGVSANELARWLGIDPGWLERLAARGDVPADRHDDDLIIDPRRLADVLTRAPADPVVDVRTHPGAGVEPLVDVVRAFARGEAPEAACARLLDRIALRLHSDCAALFLTDDDDWLRLAAVRGLSGDRLPEVLEGVAVWAAANSEPLLLPDPRRSVVAAASGDAVAPRDALAAPIVLDDRVLGVFVVMRRPAEPAFGRADVETARAVADEISLAVERARVQRGLGRRLDDAHRQLEAYAVDVRTTFAAEKARTRQLVDALSELERTYLATVRGLAAAVEAKDSYTAGHLVRVTRYGLMTVEALAPEVVDDPQFEYGFLLHDVGKLGVPDGVLGKRGPLSDDEWALMRNHPEMGTRIIHDIPFLEGARDIVLSHHERWDGRGYPRGLAGEDIPLGARAFAVVDAFDAMTTDRPYRKACSFDEAAEQLRAGSGTQFWPDAVDAFLSIPEGDLVGVAAAAEHDDSGLASA